MINNKNRFKNISTLINEPKNFEKVQNIIKISELNYYNTLLQFKKVTDEVNMLETFTTIRLIKMNIRV